MVTTLDHERGRDETIAPDVLYPLPELAKRGIGQTALRTARRNGLEVRKLGRKAFVLGADLIEHIKQHGERVQ